MPDVRPNYVTETKQSRMDSRHHREYEYVDVEQNPAFIENSKVDQWRPTKVLTTSPVVRALNGERGPYMDFLRAIYRFPLG